MATHGLTFGALDLAAGDSGGGSYRFDVLANGFTPGSPAAAKVVVSSLMRDGDDERITRYGNRVMEFKVQIVAADTAALADAEVELMAEIGGRNELRWTPPDGYGATTVFEVVNSTMDPLPNDLDELRHVRTFALSLTCKPWARSLNLTRIAFAPGTVTTTTLDDAATLTNWSVAPSSSPATLSLVTHLGEASVQVQQTAIDNNSVLLKWSGTLPGTPYIAIDADKAIYDMVLMGGSAPVATERQAGGYVRSYFPTPSSAPVFTLWGGGTDAQFLAHTSPGNTHFIGGLYSASNIPSTGVLAGPIGGTVPTEGVVTVTGSVALGDTMVYSDPAMLTTGYIPDDSSTWAKAPEGTYAVWVSYSGTYNSGDTFTATVGSQSVRSTVSWAGSTRWFPLGRLALGGRRDGRLGAFTMTFAADQPAGGTAGTPSVRLFRMAEGTSLTYVRGLTKKRLLIDLPSLDYPRGGVWAGDLADGSDAATVLDITDSWEFPALTPSATALFVRASGVAAPALTADYYKRFHTNAAA